MLMLKLLFGITVAIAAWLGPTSGPSAQSNKKISFIMSDGKNGGVIGAKAGFMEATRLLGWKVEVRDADGNMNEVNRAFEDALNSNFDGIVLCGFQPNKEQLKLLHNKKKPPIVVGWHSGTKPGPSQGLFTNVSTDPAEVGKMTIEALKSTGSRTPGVILITDSRFSIAKEKTNLLSKTLKSCPECRLLAVADIPITDAQTQTPGFVQRMNERFGKTWTHTIAINDIYFDNMNFPLKEVGRSDIANLAAGDGSRVAISRIKGGGSQQAVTVAEPLFAQGWQIADELNRGFAGQKDSGFISKPIVVDQNFLSTLHGDDIEEPLGFRKAYSEIWQRY